MTKTTDTKNIDKKGYYWCTKCCRVHKKGRGKIYRKHMEFARDVSDYELRRLQFKQHWNSCAKEASEKGAVNLPKRDYKRSKRYTS